MVIANEELRSANVRMLKEIQKLEKGNAVLQARVAELAAAVPTSASGQVESLREDKAELVAAQAAMLREREEERERAAAAHQSRARELSAALEEAAQVRKDAVASLDDAHTVFERSLEERDAEIAVLRQRVAELALALESASQREASATLRADAAEAERVTSLGPPPVLADASPPPDQPLGLSPAQIAALEAAAGEAEGLRAELCRLEATGRELEAQAELRAAERERVCLERESAAAKQAHEAAAALERESAVAKQAQEAAAAALAEADRRAWGLEAEVAALRSEAESLLAETASLRRQLAETLAAKGPQGTGFQQFVALKREIGALRTTLAALTRQDGRAGSSAMGTSAMAGSLTGGGLPAAAGSSGALTTPPRPGPRAVDRPASLAPTGSAPSPASARAAASPATAAPGSPAPTAAEGSASAAAASASPAGDVGARAALVRGRSSGGLLDAGRGQGVALGLGSVAPVQTVVGMPSGPGGAARRGAAGRGVGGGLLLQGRRQM